MEEDYDREQDDSHVLAGMDPGMDVEEDVSGMNQGTVDIMIMSMVERRKAVSSVQAAATR